MQQTKFDRIGYAVLVVGLIIAPSFIYPIFLMKVLCFALFACAFNLLIGFTGLLSFGHAVFFGGAGYVFGWLVRDAGWGVEISIVAAILFAAAIGLVMGALAIRRQGIYFTMITLALAQLMYFIFLQAPFTGGEDGLQGVPRGKLLGLIDLSNDTTTYFVTLALCVAAFAFIIRIIASPFGQVLKAIKENEARAISLGYDVNRYKLLAFILSAALTGIAGATKTLVLGSETLTDVHWTMSGLVVLMTLVGGMGTMLGPVVGALVIILLENKLGEIGEALANLTHVEWFRTMGDSVTMVTGLIFIICVLAFRKGLVGELLAWRQTLRKQRA